MPSGRVFHPEKYCGQKYGRLTVLSFSGIKQSSGKFRHPLFRCSCDCGEIVVASLYNIRSGNTESCGCLRREVATRHGMHGSAEYKIWEGIVTRGSGKYSRALYAQRNIKTCDEWTGEGGFQSFINHIGPRPTPHHSVDRIDNNRGYEPGNVRWATSKQQSRNTSRNRLVTLGGETMCLAEACERYGIKYGTAFYRLKRGWSVEKTFGRPP